VRHPMKTRLEKEVATLCILINKFCALPEKQEISLCTKYPLTSL